MTWNYLDSDMLVHAEKITSLRDDERSTPKGWIRGHTKIDRVLEIKLACHLYQYGIEIKNDSIENDGSHSWTVISRELNKYANELPEENEKSNHSEEMTTDTARPVATKQKEQYTPPLSSLSTIVVPIDQRKWKDILASDNGGKGSLTFSVLKPMT